MNHSDLDNSRDGPDHDRLDGLAEEYAALCRAGDAPSVGEFAARHPEHAEEIRALLPSVALMEQLRRRKRSSSVTRGARTDDDPAPDHLGEFRILREVGRGGMGIVYEAEQTALGRRVAVKVLPRHALLEPTRLRRFEREAQAAARLHHTNIVPLFGVGEVDGLHYLVMPFIHGEGLDRLATRWREEQDADRRTRRETVASIGLQAAEALAYAHAQGILHRDVKPSNLLLDQDGVLWISDFGLAKFTTGDDLTETGDFPGTLRYMAPERLQSEATERSDVYSLGLTLYELLTLEPAYGSSSPSELIALLTEGKFDRPRKKDPTIPRDLETIVLKAVERDPGHRYADAGTLAEDLRRYLDDRPILAKRASTSERLWRWCRRNRALAGLGATAAVSLIVAAVVGWSAYGITRDALDRESNRRGEAEKATTRAEENVALSLEAIEDLFNTLDPNDFGPPSRLPLRPEADEPDGAPQPGDRRRPPPGPRGGRPEDLRGGSEHESALLGSVLAFYDKFAARNATNPHLQREAAKAHLRVGDIQRRLERNEDAETAYLRAGALFEAALAAAPTDDELIRDVAEAAGRSAEVASTPEVLRTSEQRLERALQALDPMNRSSPDDANLRALRGRIEGAFATILERSERAEDAEARYRKAIECTGASGDPACVGTRSSLRVKLADLLITRERKPLALEALNAAAEDLQTLAVDDPQGPHEHEVRRWVIARLELIADKFRDLNEDSSGSTLDDKIDALRDPRHRRPLPPEPRPGPAGRRPPPRPPRDRPPPRFDGPP